MKKLISSLLLVMLMVTMLVPAAFAASGVTIAEVQVDAQSKSMELILDAAATSAYKAADYNVTLDGQQLTVKDSVRYSQSNHGTTWVVVFDRKLSDYNDRIEKLLTSIVSLMGSNDNAAIVYAGDTLSSLDTVDTFASKIKSLPSADESIQSYYRTIGATVSYLEHAADVKERAVMILISTGTNTDGTGMTREQAVTKVQESDVVVHAIALHYALKAGEDSKITSFLNLSSNGGTTHKAALTGDSINADNIVADIYNVEQKRQVVTCSLEGLTSFAKGDVSVSLLGSTPATITLTPEQAETVKSLVAVKPDPTSLPTAEPTDEPIPEPDPVPMDMILYIAIGVIALVCVVLVVLLLRRKPIKGREFNVDDLKPNVTPDAEEKPHAGTQVDEDEAAVRVSMKPVNGGDGVHFDQDMRGELNVGREPGEGGLVIPERDEYRLISRLHMTLFMKNGAMYIQNESRNGTSVNGTNIGSTPAVLHENDRVTIGRVDFIITWHRIS